MPHIDLTSTSQSLASLGDQRLLAMTSTDPSTVVYVMSTDTAGVTTGGVMVQALSHSNARVQLRDSSAFLYYVLNQGSAPSAVWVDGDAAPGVASGGPYWTVSGPSAGAPWTANHTLVAGELAPFDTTAGSLTATLPTAVGSAGQRCGIKDATGLAGTNPITVATTSGQTVDGSAPATIAASLMCRVYVSNGANWLVEHN